MSTHNDAVADALIAEVAQLRAERDNAIAECVMHIGNAKALRDRLNWFEEAGGVAMATRIYQVIGERDALAALLRRIIDSYNAYRRRGVAPAPIEYADVVRAIVLADAALAGKDAT